MNKEQTIKQESKVRGGQARAEALTPEERRRIAKDAAHARWGTGMPKAEFTGEIKIGDVSISCAVLDDGTRLLTQEGFLKALGRAPKAKGGQGASVVRTTAFFQAKNLEPFIPKDLEESIRPLGFRTANGANAFGYKAELLPKVCDVFLDAKEAGVLAPSQAHIAKQAQILVRGLAHVGITALVDEATGYQEVRDRLALQKILDKYLTDEWAKWTKIFPESFYKQLFRLRNLPYPPISGKKPQYVGHWTNDIVYSRLAPGVLKTLREMNPRTASGNRKRKHHQHLTRDYGHPELKDHLIGVEALMRASTSWEHFKKSLDKAYPRYGDAIQEEMFPDEM